MERPHAPCEICEGGDTPALPARKPKPDANTTIVLAVDRVTDSEPVLGKDLLPRRLAKKLRGAKPREVKRSAKPA